MPKERAPRVKTAGQVSPDVEETTTLTEDVLAAAEKIKEGHKQVADARRADLDLVGEGSARAWQIQQRLSDDREVLARYGKEMPATFDRMADDALFVAKVMAHAATTLANLMANDGVLVARAVPLTPEHDRG